MEEKDFPGLYQAADSASIESQKYYKNILGFDLATMVISAALAVYNYEQLNPKEIIYIISGVFLITGLILTIIVKTKKYEDIWYQGRALAESCKTLTWRYITCSESFERKLEDHIVNRIFIERVREFSSEFEKLNESINAKIAVLPVITDKMKNIRKKGLKERKEFYIKNRIEDQKKWYAQKAQLNKDRYNQWFLVVIISQALSIIAIAFLINNPDSNWNFVGLFTTISGCAISWLQLKQHQELKQAYTTAAQELNFILAETSTIRNEEELSKFVLDAENAISREHTLWIAQKRK